ncbi:NAD(P)/FAD-dependent oxidoreductase [Chamaesiphon minutus]|uniref:Glycine/D-amino acid oxidase, deaminating n=1 Tax=Chamaesiphon minutus (strain ATCC 27169 / PCC 6605) TaxID=1173020 RepID=K9U8P8_CHAP6|nr:FAD-dependent oxidoreductase [Chamaesiphon minutus]AFY91457.1 glycine/D-amino acid oxidase, deaminating [Chamaesiphon minutus PCC 6605]
MSISIIGCGIIGATIAYELSQSTDFKIDVYDRQQPAQAATGAALGVMMGIISTKVKGRAWNLRRDSIRRYQTLIPELEKSTGIKIPHNSQGIVKLLSSEDDLSKWTQLVTSRTEQEWQLELWNARKILTQLPQIDRQFTGTAAYSPQDLQVDPVALTNALVAAAKLNGVNFHFDRSIESIRADNPNSCELLTADDRKITSDRVIVTAGLGATSLLAPHASIDIQPVLGQAIQIRLSQPLGNPDFQPVIVSEDVNIVPCGGNDYWVGATVEFPVDGAMVADPACLERVKQIAIGICPDLAKGEIIRTWQGLRPRPNHRPAPVIDRVGKNQRVLVATGHYRNGILLAPATARIIGDMLLIN